MSYGDSKANESNRRILPVRLTGSGPVSPSPEKGGVLLLVSPAEELLKSGIGLDFLDGIERIPQFVVRPSFVDEILAGVAGWCRVPSAFASRDHVMPSRGHFSLTKCANFGHTTGPIFLEKHIHSLAVRHYSFQNCEPLAGLFHQLTPSVFQICINNERAEPLELLRVQGFEMVRASGNAPDPGTHLVRLSL